MSAAGHGDDIMLKLVHTADWHLGRQFRSFPEDGALKLVARAPGGARPDPPDRRSLRGRCGAVRWRPVRRAEPGGRVVGTRPQRACAKAASTRPVFLLPGNHDPLTTESIWAKGHKFRSLLPDWVHVVDREDFQYTFPNGAVLYAVPCMSKAGQRDPTECIPKRAAGDERIRIGMVHGSTFDAKDWQTNFPIHPDAVLERGLDYLAIGDTHGFRYIPPDRQHPPTIYPGAPEATAFDEKDPGCVAVVFINRQRVATVRPERVARWTWEECTVTSIDELRALVRRTDLADRVLRLHVNMKVPRTGIRRGRGADRGAAGHAGPARARRRSRARPPWPRARDRHGGPALR